MGKNARKLYHNFRSDVVDLITFYVLLLKYNIWTIFLLGIPGQTSVVLWACLGIGGRKLRKPKPKKVEDEKE